MLILRFFVVKRSRGEGLAPGASLPTNTIDFQIHIVNTLQSGMFRLLLLPKDDDVRASELAIL